MFKGIQMSLASVFPNFSQKDVNKIPSCEQLNQDFDCTNINQKKLIFSTQDGSMVYPTMGYEERIYRKGIIATRRNNWHDFFNAMVWHNFSQTKIAINAIHYREIQVQKDSKRSRKRDLLTLFDECGVIVIAKTYYLDLLREHKWHELFIENKDSWLNGEIQIVTFGHAMFEKYLNPYIGMTAKALLFESMPNDMDGVLSHSILDQTILQAKVELSPLPLLGIPGWYKNQNNKFYANKNYFR